MNQVAYDGKKKKEVVYEEDYKGHHIVIVSHGTHPCAYVSAGKAEAKLPKSYFDFDISCHGGVTFYSDLRYVDKKFGQQIYVGWDYAHLDDYYRFGEISFDGKKWTAEEILEEAHRVTDQLVDKYEGTDTKEELE
jgi:hypothetical protein